ncbi:unnamed protein product [Arabis nemorensis]|uniref:CCHC-type domain-containing protein n=1 Tax=Arabis nemorensis TaxID=586526 RepID=A0A565BU01_9BRAS|nr:unnamed protein product [Arabis nemorensis]
MVEGLRQVFGQQPPPAGMAGNMPERNIEDENKLLKCASQKTLKAVEPSRQQHDNRGSTSGKDKGVLCTRCGKSHGGPCMNSTGLCFNCGQPGHTKATCRKFMGTCHKCGKVGHRAMDCRVR